MLAQKKLSSKLNHEVLQNMFDEKLQDIGGYATSAPLSLLLAQCKQVSRILNSIHALVLTSAVRLRAIATTQQALPLVSNQIKSFLCWLVLCNF